MNRINELYLSGKNLYGDDFNFDEISQWYKEEEEAYAKLVLSQKEKYIYKYHEINKYLGFSSLPKGLIFDKALSYGGAFGDEVLPIISQIKDLIIIEASEQLRAKKIDNLIPIYLKPKVNGVIDIKNDNINIITCFGVLHHIPNVTFIISEFHRILKKDGYLLLKEPIVSMGDWNKDRIGLTKNERGIPKEYFEKLILNSGFIIIKRNYCTNPITRKLGNMLNVGFNSRFLVIIDKLISLLTQFNYHYHPKNIFQKLQPQAVFYVLKKK
jgi:hypothetical protein